MGYVEPLVLLPPMLCDARVFAPQVAELGRERAVMVAPVHGAERVEELASALLDVLPQKFALAGQGFGGVVALEIARRAKKRVHRLALVATSPLAETPEDAAAREPRIIAARMGRLEDMIAQELPQEVLSETAERPRIMSLVREMAKALGPEAYIRQSRAMQRRKDQTGTLRDMEIPVQVLGSEDDPLVAPKRLEFLAELVPGLSTSVIAGAGRLPSLEQPVATNDALREWLGSPLALR